MATIQKALNSLPPKLQISVDYYDAAHEALLTAPPYPKEVKDVAGKTIEVSSADLLAYYLFWKQRARPDLYSNLANVRAGHLEEAAGELANLITFRGGTIHAEASVREGSTSVTGRLGEAVGLSVMNQIHNLTNLDWVALPERRNLLPKGLKPMDYRNVFGSNGTKTVQIECKGSFLDRGNLRAKPSKISNHAASIAAKKDSLNKLPLNRPPIWSADLRYGTITTFGKIGDGAAHCWLLDPPSFGGNAPEAAQSISRLLNVTYWLRLIAPRSHFSTALANRAAAVAASQSTSEFEGIPLMRGSGKSLEDLFEIVPANGSCSSKFFLQRSTVDQYPAGGAVFPLRAGGFMFVGVREDLLSLAVRQDFAGLRKYKTAPLITKGTVHAVFPKGQAEELDLDEAAGPPNRYYVRKDLHGKLFTTSGGLVFGFLDSE